MSSVDNCLTIVGRVTRVAGKRYSPAGLPIFRFTLEHRSEQREAGFPRRANCRIVVIVCGKNQLPLAERLTPGATVRAQGFISRANHRQGENQIVLHAELIELLLSSEEH